MKLTPTMIFVFGCIASVNAFDSDDGTNLLQTSIVQRHLEGEMIQGDTPGWNNNYGYTCANYAGSWCANGAFRAGSEWTGSPEQGAGSTCAVYLTSTNTNCAMVYNYPADNCVACGKGKVKETETVAACTAADTPGWNNNYGYTCASYASWCANGAFRGGLEWTGSPEQGAGSTCAVYLTSTNTNCAMVYNYPADNCVACGKKCATTPTTTTTKAAEGVRKANRRESNSKRKDAESSRKKNRKNKKTEDESQRKKKRAARKEGESQRKKKRAARKEGESKK